MSNDYYSTYYNQLSQSWSHYLFTKVCPLIPLEAPFVSYFHIWNVLNNTIITDTIHAMLITSKFNPNIDNTRRKYSYFTYLLVSIIGATPSHLLQNALLGGSWVAIKSNYLFALYIILTTYHYFGFKIPNPFLKILRILSNMSLVMTIFFGIKRSSAMPHSGMGLLMMGIISGMGGFIWSSLVQFLWGSGKWEWNGFDHHFLRCTAISLFWTTLYKSGCHLHFSMEPFLMWVVFFGLVIEGFIISGIGLLNKPKKLKQS